MQNHRKLKLIQLPASSQPATATIKKLPVPTMLPKANAPKVLPHQPAARKTVALRVVLMQLLLARLQSNNRKQAHH
jgi:hypothetical protein